MSPPNPKSKPDAGNPISGQSASAVLEAVARVLTPVVRLLIARGIPYQVTSELLKRVYVRAGLEHHAARGESAPTGTQLSLLTGLNRKEIRRLTDEETQAVAPQGVTSYAAAVHAAWMNLPRFRAASGEPMALARHDRGDGPSFDALVRAITTDHRPSAVLEELQRLGIVQEQADGRLALQGDAFLPQTSFSDKLEQMADGVSDHAAAAVTNVLSTEPPFLERHVFSDELSDESVAALQALVHKEWQRLYNEYVTAAIAREEVDAKSAARTDRRVRVGLYFYSDTNKKDDPQ
jgi:Family of unknown function (DUF6502)